MRVRAEDPPITSGKGVTQYALAEGILAQVLASRVRWMMSPWDRRWERRLRAEPDLYLRELFQNPVIVAQVREELVFEPDYLLGHKPKPGREFVGRDRFLSFARVVAEARAGQRRLVLSVGDSSTSGWDSRVVSQNRRRRQEGSAEFELPFFRYPTYSDLMAERLEEFAVINAGVPAHSSLQGARHLALLLDAFTRAGCDVAAATFYFGNNDSCWNANYEDGRLLPRRLSAWHASYFDAIFESSVTARIWLARRLRRRGGFPPHWAPRRRVDVPEFENNVEAMVLLCQRRGIECALIEPVVPLRWPPGQRVPGENEAALADPRQPGGEEVGRLLQRARDLWSMGLHNLDAGVDPSAIELLGEALENDLVTPRAKAAYRRVLAAVAHRRSVPVVKIEVPRDRRESDYVLDYCHPIGDANARIAEAVIGTLSLRSVASSPRPAAAGAARRELDGLLGGQRTGAKAGQASTSPPETIYPLF